jgi:hypothetical protein
MGKAERSKQPPTDQPPQLPPPAEPARNGDGPPPPDVSRLLVHMQTTYHSLRHLLAIVALTFLVLLVVYHFHGNDNVRRLSISAYYHNQGRLFGLLPVLDLFVGAFASVALMLWAYKGFKAAESRLLNGAAVGLLVVVTCPMEWAQPSVVADDIALALELNAERANFVVGKSTEKAKARADHLSAEIAHSKKEAKELSKQLNEPGDEAVSQDRWPNTVTGWLHYVGALVFFGCIACVCWFHAEDTLQFIPDADRGTYRMLYRVTSAAMIGVPLTALAMFFLSANIPWLQTWVFWVEAAGVLVFVAYWTIKSRELRWGAELVQRSQQVGLKNALHSIKRGDYGKNRPEVKH